MIYQSIYNSPIGNLLIEATNEAVVAISFLDDDPQIMEVENHLTKRCKDQLEEYFKGTRKTFDLPIVYEGTRFQTEVWEALRSIPYGETACYQEIAIKLNNEKAVRAVGGANNRNRLPIIIPCHRIIGKSGKLVGYAGGLDKKQWLLNHERDLG